MIYRHTQRGWLVMAAVLAGAVGVAVAVSHGAGSRQPALYLLVALPIVVAVAFSSLTIEVDPDELRHAFGPGVWRKRVPLDDVTGASRTTSSWIEGWGIRLTFRGMLYNVSGTDAVEIRLRSGRAFRLGTDEPDVLLAALRQAGVPTVRRRALHDSTYDGS